MVTAVATTTWACACRFAGWLGLRPTRHVRLIDRGGRLEEGWVIANHKLVSFHVAFLSSLLMLTGKPSWTAQWDKWAVLNFMFNPIHGEMIISAIILYLSWHLNIAIHELGHYRTAVKTNNLREHYLARAKAKLANPGWTLKGLLTIPYGRFPGVMKQAGSYFPDVKAQNPAVSAAGPLTAPSSAWLRCLRASCSACWG